MTAPADHPARLRARPDPSAACPPPEVRGLIPLNLGGARDGLLYVPQRHPLEGPRPLIVACHGAGSEASHSVPAPLAAMTRSSVPP